MILIQTIFNLRTSRVMLLPINLRDPRLMRIRDLELLFSPLTPVRQTTGNSVIYTGTSPTIFAGSNATVITTTTPEMITQTVQVRSFYQMMLEKVREDLREYIRHQLNKQVGRRVEIAVEGKCSLLIESMALVVMRNTEDYALNKMVALLPDTNRDPFHILVKEFRKKFTIQEWCDNDYHLLANAPARIDANEVAHLDINEPRAKRLKDALWEHLAKKRRTRRIATISKILHVCHRRVCCDFK